MDPNDAVLRFLSSIAQQNEFALYLDLFRSERPESFAIVSLAGQVNEEALALDLHCLERLDLHPYVASPDEDLIALAAERKTRKLLLLGPWQGLEPTGRAVPSQVDLTTEYDDLLPLLPAEQQPLLRQAREIIDAVDHNMTVAVTSAFNLLRELFTVRGAGTMIRRGAVVTRHSSMDSVDRERLSALMESAFDAPPDPDVFSRPVDGIYIAADYAGAAVVAPSELGPYLTKFAVDRRAQGEGIGRDLWRAMATDCPTLFWRSRATNPITAWYQQQCDGTVRTDIWHVFWRGLSADRIPRAIELALAAPNDFDAR